MAILIAIILSPLLLLLFQWLKRRPLHSLPLPPGPKGVPVLGNMFDIPSSMPWKQFREWSNSYGDVLYLKTPTQAVVILGSAQAALDLLDKRSDIYSSRPHIRMLDIVSPRPWNFAVMEYGPRWRTYRRQFHQIFHQHAVSDYQPIQLQQSRAFLQRALDEPDGLSHHIHLCVYIVFLWVPGKFWVESLPILRYVPNWLPGAYFKKWAMKYGPIIDEMVDKPFDAVMQNIALGKAGPSVVTNMTEKIQGNASVSGELGRDEREEIARGVTGAAYGAAADTTTAAAQSFFIAMSLYPDVQRKAQQELDRVVGPDRLPVFDDYDNLIYIQAVALECMRWMPVAPIGMAHSVIRDDEYKGLFIPKGTMIIANQWAMLHDPDDYPEPERFNPDRFIKDGKLNPDVRNPTMISFGFGRRICPGRWLSSGSLFITIASVLHTLDIYPILGSDGMKFDPSKNNIEGSNLVIENVPCTVMPRSENAKRLIREWSSSL